MIGRMVLHDGGRALAIHLARTEENESVVARTHGLSTDTIAGAIAELRLMALGCRTQTPLLHICASPSRPYTEMDWAMYWRQVEAEFGLEGQPFLEACHLKFGKNGRTAAHAHRVYLRIGPDGRAIRTSFSAMRMEKVSRTAEVAAGEPLTSGRFNRAVIARLEAEGRPDVANAMIRAGLEERQAATAPSPAERAMTERLHDLAADEVWARAYRAWIRSDTGPALEAALRESGLRLAMGDRCPVIVSPAGAVHPLLRAINRGGAREAGTPIKKAALDRRLLRLTLRPVGALQPVSAHEAGFYAITGLTRLPPSVQAPVPNAAPPAPSRHDSAADARILTPQQEQALIELEQAFLGGAAEKARRAREGIEDEVARRIAYRREIAALRGRIHREKAAWQLPSIGAVGWRDAYRAALAGLPKAVGPQLRWVEKLDAERSRVVLRTGTAVTLAPTHARADRPDRRAIPIMVAHGRQRGWTRITITGGSQRWREAMARAAVRAGLIVADPDLEAVAIAEAARMRDDELLERWQSARRDLTVASAEERRRCKRILLGILAEIHSRPELIDRTDETTRNRLVADLNEYLAFRERLQEWQQVAPSPLRPR